MQIFVWICFRLLAFTSVLLILPTTFRHTFPLVPGKGNATVELRVINLETDELSEERIVRYIHHVSLTGLQHNISSTTSSLPDFGNNY